LHDTGKLHFSHFNGKVNVVRHQAEGVDAISKLLDTFLQEKV
jgi:hypothetical protein